MLRARSCLLCSMYDMTRQRPGVGQVKPAKVGTPQMYPARSFNTWVYRQVHMCSFNASGREAMAYFWVPVGPAFSSTVPPCGDWATPPGKSSDMSGH